MSTKTIIENTKKTLEILVAPISAIALVWGTNVSAYVAATSGVLISILSYVEIFVKDK